MASLFAATYPERVSALVLYGCFARNAWAPHYPWGQTKEQLERSTTSLLENWGRPFNLNEAAPSVPGDPRIQSWFAAYMHFPPARAPPH